MGFLFVAMPMPPKLIVWVFLFDALQNLQHLLTRHHTFWCREVFVLQLIANPFLGAALNYPAVRLPVVGWMAPIREDFSFWRTNRAFRLGGCRRADFFQLFEP